MLKNICSHEIAVALAVRADRFDDALRDHAATCKACREVIHVATGMRALAADLEGYAELPDPAWLWRKALLEKKQAEADRTLRLFHAPQLASIPFMILGFIIFFGWSSNELLAFLQTNWRMDPWARLSSDLSPLAAQAAQVSPESFSLVFLLTVAALVGAYPLLAEE